MLFIPALFHEIGQFVLRNAQCPPETLRKWVKQAEIDQGKRDGLTSADRDRLKELERENRELRQANEILRKASVANPAMTNLLTSRTGASHAHWVELKVTGRKGLNAGSESLPLAAPPFNASERSSKRFRELCRSGTIYVCTTATFSNMRMQASRFVQREPDSSGDPILLTMRVIPSLFHKIVHFRFRYTQEFCDTPPVRNTVYSFSLLPVRPSRARHSNSVGSFPLGPPKDKAFCSQQFVNRSRLIS